MPNQPFLLFLSNLMYLGLLSVMINQRHFKQLFRRALAPFARSVLLFCTLILLFPWFSTAVFAADTPGIELTPEERAWLQDNPHIRFATLTNQPPFSMTDADGNHVGMLADILTFLSNVIGQEIETELVLNTVADTHEKARDKGIYGSATILKSSRNAEQYLLTNSYYSTPFYVYTTTGKQNRIRRAADLKGKRVVIPRNHRVVEGYVDGVGGVQKVFADTPLEQMHMVVSGQADALIGYFHYPYLVNKYLMSDLMVAYIAKYGQGLHIGVNREHPILRDILDKAIARLDSVSINKIAEKWTGVSQKEALDLPLTPEEQTWLAEHPDIVLGAPTTYPPFVIERDDGAYEGVLVDYIETVGRLLGHRVRLHIEDPWAKVQEKATDGEIDGLALGARVPQREVHFSATDTVFDTYYSVFARSKEEYPVKRFSDLEGMRIAYREGGITRNWLEKLPSVDLKSYGTNEALTQALLTREVDVIVSWISYEFFRRNKLQGTIDNILLIDEYPIDMVTHIRKDWPEFVSIMNKVIAAMRQDELPRIMDRWFIEWPQQPVAPVDTLTFEERTWLDQKHVVRVRIGDIPPWNISTLEPQGMSAEYLKWIGDRFGINFQFIADDKPWIDGFKDIAGEHQRFDLYPTVERTPERLESLAMSDEYLQSPWVVFTRDDVTDVYEIDDLKGKKIAVERGFVMHDKLKKVLPEAELVVRDGEAGVLLALSAKQADAYVGNLIITSYFIERLGISNIKVACPTPFGMHSQAMATRKEWAPLISLINKGLSSMPAHVKNEIRSKYSAIIYDHGIRAEDLRKWILISIATVGGLLLILLVWNKQLGRKVKKRTSELSDSESRFRATFEQAAVGIAHVSLEGRFLRLNQKFCDIVGYSHEEMLDLTFQDITHPDDLETDTGLVQELLDGKKDFYTLEKRYLRKDGSAVWINLTVKILRKEDGAPRWFVSVIEDISDRIRIQQEVKKGYEFLDHLTQTIPDAIFSVKLPERTVTWCTDTYGVLGYTADECIGETTARFYPSIDQAKQFGTLMENAIADGKRLVQTELEMRRKNGETFPAEVKLAFMQEGDHVTGVTALLRDISERKQAENELQQSHDFFHYLLNSIPDAVFYVKLPERVVAWVNDSYNIMGLGESPEHLKGLSTMDFFASKKEYNRFGEVQSQAIEEGKSFMHTEVMVRHADGTVFPADVTGTFFREDGEVSGITAIVRDITEAKLAEKKFVDYQERLKALTSQLTIVEEQERRRIAENLHDEVGQALAMARLQLAAAIRGIVYDDPGLKEQLDEISGSLLQVIRDTRQLIFELSSPSMHELGLSSAIMEWVEEKKKQLEGDVDIAIVDELAGAEFDEDERTILFRNIRELLTNTFKHARAKKVNVILAADEESVRVTVEDDGIGFDPAQVMGGYNLDGGFGLFSIEERIKDLNGSMKVEAAPHKGCKVTLSLPRAME